MSTLVVVGSQWGDEGKGKVIDFLSERADVVVRFQGGANAGHTVITGDEKYVLHLVPSGILHEGKLCMIGNGVVVDPCLLIEEIDHLKSCDIDISPKNFLISRRAQIVFPYHRSIDASREKREGGEKIGTTCRGIGPAYEDRASRIGIRMGELEDFDLLAKRLKTAIHVKNQIQRAKREEEFDCDEFLETARIWKRTLEAYLGDVDWILHERIAKGENILFEGAQGTLLDIDFGTYPYVTSSHCIAGAACVGTGVGPKLIDSVMGVVKAYATRVGEGPFPTELTDETGGMLQSKGVEFGATTGRKRRCGWLDLVLLKYACRINGFTFLALTKLDVLAGFDSIKACVAYELDGVRYDHPPSNVWRLKNCKPVYEEFEGFNEKISDIKKKSHLPKAALRYIKRIEEFVDVPVTLISTGKSREENIVLKDFF